MPGNLKPYKKNIKSFFGPRIRMRKLIRQWLGLFFFLLFFLYVLIYEELMPEGETSNGNMLIELVEGWNYNTSRDIRQYIASPNLTSIFMPNTFCKVPHFLLVIVCSAPSNYEARSAIRYSWGSQRDVNSKTVSVYFLLGETSNDTLQDEIATESEIYGDIIQERFVDSYNNLTLKTVVMLKQVTSYCTHSVQFMLKTDDDMFVHMPPLIKMLKGRLSPSNMLIGSLICGAKPIKDSTNKWYAPRYMYTGRVYPNYLSGTAYLMSIDVVSKLYSAALRTPIFHLEDVYITGICTRDINIKPQNHAGFTYQMTKFEPCTFKDTFTMHRLSPQAILDLFYVVTNTDLNETCAQQIKQRKNSVLDKALILTNAVFNLKRKVFNYNCV